MIGENILYVHRFHKTFRVSLEGTRLPVGEVFSMKSLVGSTILLEDDSILSEIAGHHDDPVVASRARVLHVLSNGLGHPFINTVDGFMVAANTWLQSDYTPEQIATARENPAEAAKGISAAGLTSRFSLSLWRIEQILKSVETPSDAELFAAAHNIAVWASVPSLMRPEQFLDADHAPMIFSKETLQESTTSLEGVNLVLLEPRKTKRGREAEGELLPRLFDGAPYGRHLGGPRPAKYLSISSMLRQASPTGNPQGAIQRGIAPRVMPLDVLATGGQGSAPRRPGTR